MAGAVLCPALRDGACALTKLECDGRLRVDRRIDEGPPRFSIESVGFPCQEPSEIRHRMLGLDEARALLSGATLPEGVL